MKLVRLLVVCVCCVCGLSTLTQAADAPSGKQRVYFGTYTGKSSKGIYRCELDLATGKLSAPVLAGEAVNPSFLAIAPNQKFLYAVGELSDVNGKKGGAVNAFAIDEATGDLKLLNQQSSVGSGPCHISVDRSGKTALVANYGGGSTAVLPIHADGKLGEASSFVQHKGHDPVKRQTAHTACAFDQRRCRQPIRVCGGPRTRPGAGLQARSRQRDNHPE